MRSGGGEGGGEEGGVGGAVCLGWKGREGKREGRKERWREDGGRKDEQREKIGVK